MITTMRFNGTLAEYFKQERDMDKLIEILNNIENDNVNVIINNGIISGIHGVNKDLALVWVLAEELLITEDGECNWVNIERLKNKGFDVFANTSDNLGWTSGCIKTKRGILVYG